MSTVVRMAELDIDPAQLEPYRVLLAEEIEASVRLESGVSFLYAVSIADTPNLIRIIEGYVDQAAYESHLLTPHFLKYKRETAAMVRGLRLVQTMAVALHSRAAIHLP